MSARPMTVRLPPEEEDLVKRLADELDLSISDVFRQALAILGAESNERLACEEAERREGAELLSRIREAGHLADDEAMAGQPVSIDVVTTRRVVVRWAGHTFQDIGGRLVVARRQLDGQVEIAYLDGPEPDGFDMGRVAAYAVVGGETYRDDDPRSRRVWRERVLEDGSRERTKVEDGGVNEAKKIVTTPARFVS